MQDNSTYYDKPDKHQKHSHYEHKTTKLIRKNNEFTTKTFQKARKVSNKAKLIKSFKRIGKCLNEENVDEIPTTELTRVCLILINNYEHEKHDPKIGSMNDGYLLGLNHHRLGFKIFYLYNCQSNQYTKVLNFFLKNTKIQLTVYYSGPDSIDGIEFKDEKVSCNQFGDIISNCKNDNCKFVFISDCISGGSVFDIQKVSTQKMITFSVNKIAEPDSKDAKRSHGIFTYYFCKIIYEQPNITPKRFYDRMNAFLKRFNESFTYDFTDKNLEDESIFQ